MEFFLESISPIFKKSDVKGCLFPEVFLKLSEEDGLRNVRHGDDDVSVDTVRLANPRRVVFRLSARSPIYPSDKFLRCTAEIPFRSPSKPKDKVGESVVVLSPSE